MGTLPLKHSVDTYLWKARNLIELSKEKNLFILNRFEFKDAWYECKYVVAFDGQLELILTRSQLQEGFQVEVEEKSCYSPNMDVPIVLFITLKSQGFVLVSNYLSS